jgi:DNA replication and repair protein RecF
MAVHLDRLDLTDFRNYGDLRLELGPGRFVLAGDNAQGKSNLCEAIRLLATTKSFRAASDRELVRWGAGGHFARIHGEVTRAAGPLSMEIIITAPPLADDPLTHSQSMAGVPLPAKLAAPSKRIRLNGVPRRALDCVGIVNVVLFEPSDLDLVIGSPSVRRHFMDVTLCQISRSYCRALTQFQRIITQRAALLKRIRDNQDDPRALAYWDAQMADQAIPLITERAGLIARCTPPADELARQLGGTGLILAYQPSFPVDPEKPVAESKEAFLEKLASLRRREIMQGVNLLGPHRDDLAFLEGQINLATFGSRGQQRTAALALKLAELEAVETETGDQPILVLDDVLSELDPKRREALLANVSAVEQTFLTTAEPDALSPAFSADAHMLAVKTGTIEAAGV